MMSRLLRLSALGFAVLAFTACKEIKVENGEVPDQYRDAAKAYTGVYKGKMDGDAGQVTVALSGRKVVVTYKDAEGTDILEPACKSQIGLLTKVKASKDGKTYKLDQATFAFEPNNCWPSVDGRELTLDFKKKESKGVTQIQMSASILLRQEWQQNCHIEPGNPRAGVPPREVCDQVPVTTWSTGKFTK